MPRPSARLVFLGLAAAGLFALLPGLLADTDGPVAREAVPSARTLATRTLPSVPSTSQDSRRRTARERHADTSHPVTSTQSNGRSDEELVEEERMAKDNRARLLEDNVLSLEEAALAAEIDGRHEQAALMRKRARRLEAIIAREG